MTQNRYSADEIFEFDALQGPDGVYYPVVFRVIGIRKRINGQPVDDSGAPKKE